MPRPYSTDLRERAVEAVESGASRREIAEIFKVGVSSVIRWCQRWSETGARRRNGAAGVFRRRALGLDLGSDCQTTGFDHGHLTPVPLPKFLRRARTLTIFSGSGKPTQLASSNCARPLLRKVARLRCTVRTGSMRKDLWPSGHTAQRTG